MNFLFGKDISPIRKLLMMKATAMGYELMTETGNPVTFTTDLAKAPKSLIITLEPVQAGSGDPSPTNPRSISGRSSVVLKQIAENMLTDKFTTGTFGTVTFTVDGGAVKTSGTASSITAFRSDAVSVTEGQEYKLTGCPSGGGNSTYRLDVRDTSGNIIDGLNYDSGSGATFTIPTGTTQIKIGIRIASGVDTTGLVFMPILVKSTDVPTEHTATIPTPPGTVYGGEIDWVNGKLKVTHAIVDMGSLTWTTAGTDTTGVYRRQTQSIKDVIKKVSASSIKADMYCECYATITMDNTYTKIQGIGVNKSGYVAVYDPNYNGENDNDTFKTSVTGRYLCYPLETPIEYNISTDEITLAVGENNLWIEDSGNIEIKFLKKG